MRKVQRERPLCGEYKKRDTVTSFKGEQSRLTERDDERVEC